MNLHVNEIFYSLQGEGGRTGEASIFVRLTLCNLSCTFCDTDFSEGQDMSLEEIHSRIAPHACRWIVWTGGEPTIQLTDEVIAFFKEKGYKQAIESNGTLPIPSGIDYTVCSPKNNYSQVKRANTQVDEIRIPIKKGDTIPGKEELPAASFYFLSPVFSEDASVTRSNIAYCVEYILCHPDWRLSVQTHKLIGIE